MELQSGVLGSFPIELHVVVSDFSDFFENLFGFEIRVFFPAICEPSVQVLAVCVAD